MLNDTNPIVESLQIDLIRKQSVSQRIKTSFALSELTIRLSKEAIKKANPSLSAKELDFLFVKYNYGDEYFKKINNYTKK